MKFTEKQIAFFKNHNIELTEENYNKLIAYYKKNVTKTLSDDDLSAVNAGTSGYTAEMDIDWDEFEKYVQNVFPLDIEISYLR